MANQYIEIKISKSKCDAEHKYVLNNYEAVSEAVGNLQPEGFILYFYLAQNGDSWTYWFLDKKFMEWAKCDEKTFTDAFKELEEKGYLVRTETGYHFYDKARIEKQEQEEDVMKRLETAAKSLGGNGYKVYEVIINNKDKVLAYKDISEMTGLTKEEIKEAFNELVEHGIFYKDDKKWVLNTNFAGR